MRNRVQALWDGEGEPGARPRLSRVAPATDGPAIERFSSYARERMTGLPALASRRDLDRLTVKLCWKLHLELSLTRSEGERAGLLEAFARSLTQIETRRLEVEPPDLVERVVQLVPETPPSPAMPDEPGGILFTED